MTPKYRNKTMHQQEQKLENMNQTTLFHQFRKKLIQIVISFSVFSFLFLHPSFPPFFYSFISHLSTFSSQLVSFATDKNYIFLLCNGILVFIAKYSSHTLDSRPPLQAETCPENDLAFKPYRRSMQSPIEKSVASHDDQNEDVSRTNEVMAEEDVEEKHVVYQITYEKLGEEEDVISDHADEEYTKDNSDCWSYEEQEKEEDTIEEVYTKENTDNWFYEEKEEEDNIKEEEEEEEEEEAIAKMSTEELNRKFDDFIRKMKEELRFEAQQQLIMV